MVESSADLEKRVADLEVQVAALTEALTELQAGRGVTDIDRLLS